MNNMKICIVSSAGGHLIQCLKLLQALKGYNVFIITFTAGHLKKSLSGIKTYLVQNPKRNPWLYVKTLPKFYNILKKEKPDVIISTGAGVAVPVSLLAKYFFGSKIIFIESFSRIYEPSQTGQILYNFADLFIVQWRALLKKYGDKAVYGGTIYDTG